MTTLAATIACMGCTYAPAAQADVVTVQVHVSLFSFRYYPKFDNSCQGSGDKAGFDPTVPVALRGAKNGAVSLGVADSRSTYHSDNGGTLPQSCELDAYVRVSNPDTVRFP